jgi:RNA recognition motif. (a.k.a. RRM, RBD, or RNP domain)
MTSKLYVTNLSTMATLSSVRQFFSACGEVVDVEFLTERSARPVAAAYVTMATGPSAARAVDSLHGAMLHDRTLLVSMAPGANTNTYERKTKAKADPDAVRIAQQYRDRFAMFYELDCASLRVTLKFMYPSDPNGTWRVQATTAGEPVGGVEATASSRELAFAAMTEQCALAPSSPLAQVRWLEVAAALKAVRAL